MSIEKFVEDQIAKAVRAGEFDNLPGRGKPVDLEAYFQTPEDLRLCYSMLKNADFVPEEVQILKDIDSLRQKLSSCTDAEERKSLTDNINQKVMLVKLAMERYRRRK
jgi:hypothetical protein